MKHLFWVLCLALCSISCSEERVDPTIAATSTENNESETAQNTAQQVAPEDTILSNSTKTEEETLADYEAEKEVIEELVIWKDINTVKNNTSPTKAKRTISTNSELPIYGDQGTAFYAYAYLFEDARGNNVAYPISLEIIELYTPKEMILADIPSTSNGQLLNSGGEFFVKAFKEGQEIFLKDYSTMIVEVPNNDPTRQMDVFINSTNTDQFTDWVPAVEADWLDPSIGQKGFFLNISDTINSQGRTTTGYELSLSKLGWINCDYFYSFTGGKTSITFTSEDIDLQYIQTYLYVPSANSIMGVYNGISGDIPVGETLKAVCFAVDSNEKTHYMIKEFTVEDGQTIEISLQEGTQAEFEQLLEDL